MEDISLILMEYVMEYGVMTLAVAFIAWKVAGWSMGIERSIKHTGQNVERLAENVRNLTNNFSRLDTRVTVLSDQMNIRFATLSKKIEVLYGIRRMSSSFPGDYDPWDSASFAWQTANPNNPKK